MKRQKESTMRKLAFFIVLVLILSIAAATLFGLKIGDNTILKSVRDIRTGIDIRGGVNAVFVPAEEGVTPTETELEAARAIFETRLESNGILDYTITTDTAQGSIIVEFPWRADEKDFNAQQAIDELGATAKLSFWALKMDGDTLALDDDDMPIKEEMVLEGKHVKKAAPAFYNGDHLVTLELTTEGTKLFADATKKYLNKVIGIYMDDELLSYPTVNEAITDGQAQISGMGTANDASKLSASINAGALPYSLTSSNYSSISATLGTRALDIMIFAGIITFAIIFLFMLFVYRLPGIVAVLNLLLQISLQLLIFSNLGLTLTLPGIAGIILAIGMNVDTNIIISERIKEELSKGKSLFGAIDTAYSRAWNAILDCNITTAIVGLLLIFFGSGSMLSFGYTLIIGIITNFFIGFFISRIMTRSIITYKAFKKLWLYGYKEVAAK